MRPLIAPAAALVAVLAAAPLVAQRLPARPAIAAQQRADSARAVREARAAQATFERTRVRNLPWSNDGGRGGTRCDEIIGRFCVWYDEEQDRWTPPPEPAALLQARERLLARLDSAARRAPGDEWIAGQRVRYQVEGGGAREAVAAARECRATRWWCHALEGYAAHAAQQYGAADTAFLAALAAMPRDERRDWLDLQPVIELDDTRALRRMEPAAREAAVRRIWWLADPLWMEPGNDRKTEHYARLVHDRLQDRARTTEGIAWGDDLREIVLRFGRPIGWERIRPDIGQPGGPPSLVIHHTPHGREFLPRLDARQPLGAVPPDGERMLNRKARTTYASQQVSQMDTLAHQLAVFRRGDSAVVVAGLALDADSLPPGAVTEAGLVLAESDSSMRMERSRAPGSTAALKVTVPARTAMVSVEAREVASRRAGRARYALPLERPAGGMAISDILLLADPAARPATLDEAAPLARPGTRFRAGERVGLFWEVYRDAPGSDSLRLSLSLSRREVGGVRRMAERIGLAPSAAPVRMRWTEEPGGAALLARSTTVALPRRLPPGEYLLEVTVQPPRGAPATRSRVLTIQE
jgi:hypothetical protein